MRGHRARPGAVVSHSNRARGSKTTKARLLSHRAFCHLHSIVVSRSGAGGRIRTPDLLVRSQMLYPAELHLHSVSLRTGARISVLPGHVKCFFSFFRSPSEAASRPASRRHGPPEHPHPGGRCRPCRKPDAHATIRHSSAALPPPDAYPPCARSGALAFWSAGQNPRPMNCRSYQPSGFGSPPKPRHLDQDPGPNLDMVPILSGRRGHGRPCRARARVNTHHQRSLRA